MPFNFPSFLNLFIILLNWVKKVQKKVDDIQKQIAKQSQQKGIEIKAGNARGNDYEIDEPEQQQPEKTLIGEETNSKQNIQETANDDATESVNPNSECTNINSSDQLALQQTKEEDNQVYDIQMKSNVKLLSSNAMSVNSIETVTEFLPEKIFPTDDEKSESTPRSTPKKAVAEEQRIAPIHIRFVVNATESKIVENQAEDGVILSDNDNGKMKNVIKNCCIKFID